MYKCCVDWQRKKKKLADVLILTREWKNCPYPCVIVVPFKDVWSNRGDHHKHLLTGRAARSLSVTCVGITGVAALQCLQPRGLSVGEKQKHKKVNRNIVAKRKKNRLALQKSQLKLNCESGITLYIKKDKRKQSCSFSSRCFLPPFNLWSGLRNQILLQVFCFFRSCKNCPAKKKKRKENRQKKKTLKGIVYLFDSLRILFSYNLSAIKCGFFSFFISSISVVLFCYMCEGIFSVQ